MKTLLSSAVLAALLLAGPAFAADPMAARYGNTVVAKGADGGETKMFYNADKSFSATLPDKSEIKGTWEITADGNLCLTQKEPAPAADAKPVCNPFDATRKVGDTWETKNQAGETVTVSLVAGR